METQNMVGTWGDQENFVKHGWNLGRSRELCKTCGSMSTEMATEISQWQPKFSHRQITAHIYIFTYISTYIHESGCPYGD